MMVRRLLGIGLALSLSSTAAALDPDRSLKELHHTAWRAREGAPSQISALAQTQDGYGAREHEILRLLTKAEIMARDSCVNGAIHGADALHSIRELSWRSPMPHYFP